MHQCNVLDSDPRTRSNPAELPGATGGRSGKHGNNVDLLHGALPINRIDEPIRVRLIAADAHSPISVWGTLVNGCDLLLRKLSRGPLND